MKTMYKDAWQGSSNFSVRKRIPRGTYTWGLGTPLWQVPHACKVILIIQDRNHYNAVHSIVPILSIFASYHQSRHSRLLPALSFTSATPLRTTRLLCRSSHLQCQLNSHSSGESRPRKFSQIVKICCRNRPSPTHTAFLKKFCLFFTKS